MHIGTHRPRARQAGGWILVALTGTCVLALADDTEIDSCDRLMQERNYGEASKACAIQYEIDGKCESANHAIEASWRANRYDEILTWSERLSGSDCEAYAWQMTGFVYDEPGFKNRDLFVNAFERALAAYRDRYERGGRCEDGRGALKASYQLGRHEETLDWRDELIGTACEADGWYFAGHSARALTQYDDARRNYRRAAEAYYAAGRYAKASDVYWRVYRVARAENHYVLLEAATSSLEAAHRSDSRGKVRRAAEGLFEVFYDVGDLAAARWALNEMGRHSDDENPRHLGALALSNGNLLVEQGRLSSARTQFEIAAEQMTIAGEQDDARGAYINLVRIDLEENELAVAERHLRSAEQLSDANAPSAALSYVRAEVALARGNREIANRILRTHLEERSVPAEWRWRFDHLLGSIAQRAGDLDEAAAFYRSSVAVIEQMQRSMEYAHLKQALRAHKRGPAESLFGLEVDRGQDLAALNVVERAKGRTFLDALLHPARFAAGAEPTLLESANRRLETLTGILPSLIESPLVQPRPVEEQLPRLADRDLLVYYEALDRFWLLAVSTDGVKVEKLGVSAQELRKLVESFKESPDDKQLSRTLGEILVPAWSLPPRGGRIHVVTDQTLGEISFAALRVNDRLLLKDYVISYVPSVSGLIGIEEQTSSAHGPPVILGNPTGDLKHSADEARAVAHRLGVSARVGERASMTALAAANSATLLHVSAHVYVGSRGPRLALSDGSVYADTILAERMGARQVVLATCVSAARQGPDMWGALATAFLATGSRNVVATLGPVDDKFARKLMIRYYKKGGLSDPALALASAQRAAVARGAPASSWSPFVVFGPNGPTGRISHEGDSK